MSDNAPPLPFFDDGESIESAAQQLLDHSSQLEFVRKQNAQLAKRQEALSEQVAGIARDVRRCINGQTVCNGMMQLFLMRQKRMMEADGVPDVTEGAELERELLGRI